MSMRDVAKRRAPKQAFYFSSSRSYYGFGYFRMHPQAFRKRPVPI